MIGVLIKNRLQAVFGSAVGRAGRGKEIKKATPLKIALFALLYLFVAAVFLFLSFSISYLLASALLPAASWLYYLIFMVLSLTVIFVLSIFETKTELFECKDNDLLLSMPIKPSDIVAARVLIVLIYNYIINAILMLPAIIFYGVFAKSVLGIIGGILIFLFLPLFATALASFVGYLVAEISRKLKFKNLITVIITFVFFFAYFWVVDVIGNNIESLIEILMGMSEELAEKYKFLVFIGNAAILKPWSILSVAAVSLLSAFIAYYLISMAYIRIVTDRTGVKRAVYKAKKLKRENVIFALKKKDIRHFFSSPIYIMNGAMGLLFGLIVSVLALVNKETLKTLIAELSISGTAFASIGVALIILAASTTIISACSLSIEGKDIWIIKTMPLEPKTVLISKALMQFVISAPVVFIATVLMLIAAMPAPGWWIVYILASQIANLMFSLFGILINVAFPKFDYDNDAQAVKQSLATLVAMMGAMLVSTALLIGVFILSVINEIFGVLLLVGAPVILTVIETVLLIYPASKRYKNLSM